MEGRSVREHNYQRALLVLGNNPPSVESHFPKGVPRVGSPHDTASQETCHRKSKDYQIPEQSFHCTKERLTRREVDPRSFQSKHFHKVSKIPHVDHERGQTPTSKRLLDCSPGPQGRFLAPPRVSQEEALLGFSLQRPTVAVSRDALWAERCSSSLHKSYGTHDQNNGSRRYICAHLSGRPTHCGSNERPLLSSYEQSTSNTGIIRLDYKRQEVSQTTSPSLRLAWGSPGSAQSHNLLYSVEHGRPPPSFKIRNPSQLLHQTQTNASSRSGKLGRSYQFNSSSLAIKNKKTTENIQNGEARCQDLSLQRNETQPCQMALHTSCPTTAWQSSSHPCYSNGRFLQGVGLRDQLSTFPRSVRWNGRVFNKHIGTAHHLVRTLDGHGEKPCHPGSLRQFSCRSSYTPRHLNNIPSLNDSRTDLAKSSSDELDTVRLPHSGSLQRPSRPIEQECSLVDRMGPSTPCIQEYPEEEPRPTDRHVCHPAEQPAPTLHLTLSRQVSSGSGCSVDTLGQVGSSLPLSPVNPDFEGFAQTSELALQNCDSSDSRDPIQTMAHVLEPPQYSIDPHISSPSTIGSGQTSEGNCSYQTSRLEIIKAAYDNRFPDCGQAVNLMAAPIRTVSVNEYEKKWKAFMSYLKTNHIAFQDISLAYVIKFLTFLFYSKNLSPKTVAQYRTALSKPLLSYFGIDLTVQAVGDLLKAMCLQRPSVPVSAPSWSLNKVLTFLEGLTAPLSTVMLLRKTAFLLMLTTGWRISELSACVRDPEFCSFRDNSSLSIRPHPSFLAKNENAQKRWDAKVIKALRLRDGSVSKLCPVHTLKEYLQSTLPVKKGPLFLTPGNRTKSLSIYKLSTHICQLILMADPVTNRKVKVHDVRKYASSYAFLNTMLVGELVSAMNWSSPVTFFKFYFTQTEPLDRPVSLPIPRH